MGMAAVACLARHSPEPIIITLDRTAKVFNDQNPDVVIDGGGKVTLSGGAIYNDGNTFTLTVCGTVMENNTANEGGGAIFFVSNDRSGSLVVEDSVLRNNPSDGFETQGYPGIFVLANGDPQVRNSVIE